MSMSRSHYKAVAEVLNKEFRDAKTTEELHVIARIGGGLAVVFQQDNPRFDIATFREAVTTLPITKDDL